MQTILTAAIVLELQVQLGCYQSRSSTLNHPKCSLSVLIKKSNKDVPQYACSHPLTYAVFSSSICSKQMAQVMSSAP